MDKAASSGVPDCFQPASLRIRTHEIGSGSRAAVVARLTVRPFCPQLRKLRCAPRQLRLVPVADLALPPRIRLLSTLADIQLGGDLDPDADSARRRCRRLGADQVRWR
jgi:hypothetical protein